jgi:hypothetical protein
MLLDVTPWNCAVCHTLINASGAGYGNGWSKTPLTTLNIVVLAPIPIANVAMTASVSLGVRRIIAG